MIGVAAKSQIINLNGVQTSFYIYKNSPILFPALMLFINFHHFSVDLHLLMTTRDSTTPSNIGHLPKT